MATCTNTYYQDVPGCIPTIDFDLGLLPLTDYIVEVKLPSGKGLRISVTTDYAGDFSLTRDEDLEGFWNTGMGDVLISVYTSGDCISQSFIHCENEYGQIVLNFTNIQTDELVTDVPCTCPE